MLDLGKTIRVIVFLAITLGAAYGAYRLVEERVGSNSGYKVWAVFTDVQGLVGKSKVLIAGIQVGYIDQIRLWGHRARVDLAIRKGVKLYRDASIAKRSASILGESILTIDPGSPDQPLLKDGEQIAVVTTGTSTDAILGDVGAVAKSLKNISSQVEKTFGTDDGGRKMASALDNLTQALEGINRTIQTNEAGVNHAVANIEDITANAKPELAKILGNIADISADLKQLLHDKKGDGTSGTEKIDDTLSSINRTSHELENVMSDIREVTQRTAEGKGTVGRLTKDEALINEVQGVTEGIGDFVGGVSRLQTIVQLRSEYNFLASSFKNYVELRLQPREDSYYMIQLINDPRGKTDFSRTTVRVSPPPAGYPSYYQETRETTRDAFRFSLMFAKKVQFSTFRFGILESTGGVGVDLHLLNNSLELNTDLFAFNENIYPRLRTRLAYEFIRKFWLLAGVDDALNKTVDFFMGAQLRFNDEDLKTILPFAPAPKT